MFSLICFMLMDGWQDNMSQEMIKKMDLGSIYLAAGLSGICWQTWKYEEACGGYQIPHPPNLLDVDGRAGGRKAECFMPLLRQNGLLHLALSPVYPRHPRLIYNPEFPRTPSSPLTGKRNSSDGQICFLERFIFIFFYMH